MANTDDKTPAASQAQARSADKTKKNSDEIQFFDTSITKLVERPVLDENGEETDKTETVEVISDNLYPGEKLKREVDEEKETEKRERARKAAAKRRDADK